MLRWVSTRPDITYYLTNAANQTIYVKIRPYYIVDNVTYRYYQLLVKNSITGEILFSENTTISPGTPINSRLGVIGTSVDWYINGVNKFHLDDSNPKLTKVGDFSSASGANYESKIDNAHYEVATNYVYNSSDVTLDKGLSQEPTFDLTSKYVTIPKDVSGNPVANVDGLVGVQPGQLIITDATYDEAKQKGEPVPGKHSKKTVEGQDRNLPKEGEPLSSMDLVRPKRTSTMMIIRHQKNIRFRIDILLIGRSWELKILEVNRLIIGLVQKIVPDLITAQEEEAL